MILNQTLPVGFCSHIGIAEPVLYSRRRANVLVEELLPRLLRDGFRWHGARSHKSLQKERQRHSITISHMRPQMKEWRTTLYAFTGVCKTLINKKINRSHVLCCPFLFTVSQLERPHKTDLQLMDIFSKCKLGECDIQAIYTIKMSNERMLFSHVFFV